jgi:hypothetical protein
LQKPQYPWNAGGIHSFIGGSVGWGYKRYPMSTVTLYQLPSFSHSSLKWDSCWWQKQINISTASRHIWQGNRHSQLTNMIVQEMSDFGCNNETGTWHHGHIQRYYRSTLEHFCIPFYSNTLKYDLFLHALRFVHESTRQELWQTRKIDLSLIWWLTAMRSFTEEYLYSNNTFVWNVNILIENLLVVVTGLLDLWYEYVLGKAQHRIDSLTCNSEKSY